MAEFGIAGDTGGHTWNNALAHTTYEENVEKLGRETARDFLRKDIRSFIQEQKGQESQWSLTLQGGRMVTETGVSLDEMTANITQGRYSSLVPENIKATAPLEAATLREATRLAVAGAKKIILPEQHLDGEGNIVSRYLSVWTKNASDPMRYDGSRIDLGKNIRIEDVRTGTSFTAFGLKEDIAFHQHHEQKHAFVLEVKEGGGKPFKVVEKAIITTIHRSHQETYSRDLQLKALPIRDAQTRPEMQQIRDVFDERKTLNAPSVQKVHDVDLFVHVSQTVVREAAETVRGAAAFLRDKEKRRGTTDRILNLSVVQRIRRIFEKGDQKSEEGALHPKVQPERLTIEKIREKPVRMVEVIEKRHAEMQKSVAVLLIVAKIKVALGAAPVLLAELAKEYKPVEAVRKSMRRHERKVRRARKNFEKVQPLKTERVEPLRAAKERKKRQKSGREKGIKRIAAASEIIPSASKKRERREKRKMRQAVEKSLRRYKKKELKRETKKDSAKVQPLKTERVEPLKERKRSIQIKEREAVAGIVFGWMVWMLFVRKETETPKRSFIRSDLADLQGPTLQSKEDVPWVLLSIIYYLTAIREQGMQSNPTNPTNTPIRPKKNARVIPQYAVIFAYNS